MLIWSTFYRVTASVNHWKIISMFTCKCLLMIFYLHFRLMISILWFSSDLTLLNTSFHSFTHSWKTQCIWNLMWRFWRWSYLRSAETLYLSTFKFFTTCKQIWIFRRANSLSRIDSHHLLCDHSEYLIISCDSLHFNIFLSWVIKSFENSTSRKLQNLWKHSSDDDMRFSFLRFSWNINEFNEDIAILKQSTIRLLTTVCAVSCRQNTIASMSIACIKSCRLLVNSLKMFRLFKERLILRSWRSIMMIVSSTYLINVTDHLITLLLQTRISSFITTYIQSQTLFSSSVTWCSLSSNKISFTAFLTAHQTIWISIQSRRHIKTTLITIEFAISSVYSHRIQNVSHSAIVLHRQQLYQIQKSVKNRKLIAMIMILIMQSSHQELLREQSHQCKSRQRRLLMIDLHLWQMISLHRSSLNLKWKHERELFS